MCLHKATASGGPINSAVHPPEGSPLYDFLHCKNSMVILTNKNGYLSFTFVLSTLGTEQRYKECVGYHPGGTER